jgi:hypothetical protein
MIVSMLGTLLKAPEAIYEFNITTEMGMMSGHSVLMSLATAFCITVCKTYFNEEKPFHMGTFPNV